MIFPSSFAEAALGSVPFEDELSRRRIPALVDADDEGRRADGVGEWTGKGRSGPGAGRGQDEPQRRRGRLGETRLAQEKKRPFRLKRAAVQSSRRGEVELVGTAPDLEKHRRKGFQPRRFLGDPERIPKLAGPGEKDGFRPDAEARMQTRKIREACFMEDIGRADPEKRPVRSFLQQEACQRQRKAGYRSGIARLLAMDLDEAGARQSAAKHRVESIGSRPQEGRPPVFDRPAVAADEDAIRDSRPAGGRLQPVGEDALDFRYFPAQGKNGLPRHGAFNHGGYPVLNVVPVMFSWIPEAHSRVKRIRSPPGKEFIPLPRPFPDAPNP
jgi:hypothetical protein